MRTAMIVLNYNDYETTMKFIENIINYKSIEKIIIVDNNSTDNSYDKLKKLESDKVEIIKSHINKGYASGNNLGLRYLENKYAPKYVIISNPDVQFEEEIINSIENYLEKNDRYSIGTCIMNEVDKTRNLKAYKVSNYNHNIITTLPIIGRIYNNRMIKYKNDHFAHEYSEVDVVPGSFFIGKLNKLKEVGYFDEDTFLYCEEEILGYKLKQKGYTEIIVNTQWYQHYHSISISKSIKSNVDKHRILQESREIYIKKYLQVSKIKIGLFKLISYFSLKERYIIQAIRLTLGRKRNSNE